MTEREMQMVKVFEELEAVYRKYGVWSALTTIVMDGEEEGTVRSSSGIRLPAKAPVEVAKTYLRLIATDSLHTIHQAVMKLEAASEGATAADASGITIGDTGDDADVRRMVNAKLRGFADA